MKDDNRAPGRTSDRSPGSQELGTSKTEVDLHSTDALVATGSAARDAITILKSRSGLASKRIVAGPDGSITIEGYDGGYLFNVFEEAVWNITSLSTKLSVVEAQRDCFVIRGAPREGLDCSHPQRRQKVKFQTPPSGRRWVLIDFDKIALPPGVSLQQDIGAVCEHLIGLLPVEFHEASYHWQLSSSAGIAEASIASLHLWFWLDRPIPDAQLKAWSKHWNAAANVKLIDGARQCDQIFAGALDGADPVSG